MQPVVKSIDLFAKPQRNEKGQFVKGNTLTPVDKVGPKCKFCQDPDFYLKKIALYDLWTRGKLPDGKIHIPFLEELCDTDYLGIHTDTLNEWITDELHKTEHPELAATIKGLVMRQKQFLLKRTLGANNPSGAIFQLKANHGLMEAEKKIIAGDKHEPLQIEIIEEDKKQYGA